MTAERGAFVQRDGSNNGMTPKGARLAQGGMLARNGDSPLSVRRGVLWDGGGAVVAGTSGWSYQVRAHVAVAMATSTNGPTPVPVSAPVTVATDPAPGANSRIDVIWIRQKLVAGDGGSESTNESEIGVTKGSVAASPGVPSIPTGALALAQVIVTSGAASTSALTITRVHRWTAAAGGVIRVESSTERSEITLEGTVIHYVPDNVHQTLVGGTWKSVGGATSVRRRVMRTATNQSIGNSSTVALTNWETYSANTDAGDLFSVSGGTFTCVTPGQYDFFASGSLGGGGSGSWALSLFHNGTEILRRQTVQGSAFQSLSFNVPLLIAAGDVIEIRVNNATGGTRSFYGGSIDRGLFIAEFKGAA